MEEIGVRGTAAQMGNVAGAFISMKDVNHQRLTITASAPEIE